MVGMCVVQLVKQHFETEVIGRCSAASVKLVKSLEADRMVDYAREDFTHRGET